MDTLRGTKRPILLYSNDEGIAHFLNNGTCQVFGHFPKKGEKILKR